MSVGGEVGVCGRDSVGVEALVGVSVAMPVDVGVTTQRADPKPSERERWLVGYTASSSCAGKWGCAHET